MTIYEWEQIIMTKKYETKTYRKNIRKNGTKIQITEK